MNIGEDEMECPFCGDVLIPEDGDSRTLEQRLIDANYVSE